MSNIFYITSNDKTHRLFRTPANNRYQKLEDFNLQPAAHGALVGEAGLVGPSAEEKGTDRFRPRYAVDVQPLTPAGQPDPEAPGGALCREIDFHRAVESDPKGLPAFFTHWVLPVIDPLPP